MLDFKNYKILDDNMSTLCETSKDDAGMCMTESKYIVVNFDSVKRQYTQELHISEEKASSVDAIATFGDSIVFVEFKNGEINNQNLKNKARDSLLIFLDIIKKDLLYSREYINLVTVYNETVKPITKEEEKKLDKDEAYAQPFPYDQIVGYLFKFANKELVRFGLDRFQQIFFRSVHTYSRTEFNKFLQNMLKDKGR